MQVTDRDLNLASVFGRLSAVCLGLAIGFAVAGCRPSDAAPATNAPLATGPEATPTTAELDAIRFRSEFGLRADLAYVRAVAADPSASMEWSVPLLPAEVAELNARDANADAVRAIVDAEVAKAPEDYCGRYLDQQNGGAFTSMWRANIEIHAASILLKLSPNARVAFRICTFSEAELTRVMDLLETADLAWMTGIPAVMTTYWVDTIENRVEIAISSAVPDAADVVRDHLGAQLHLPPGMLHVDSDGNGAALIPWGTIRVRVLGPDGRSVHVPNGLDLEWAGDLPNLQCGGGDIGYGVSADGMPTEIPCQAGTWRITLDTGPGTAVLGSGTVTVTGGKTADLTIKVSSVPP